MGIQRSVLFLQGFQARLINGVQERGHKGIALRDEVGRGVLQHVRINDGGECCQADEPGSAL